MENRPADYKVTFGRTARTVVYEDQQGSIVFTFDMEPEEVGEEKKWIVWLERSGEKLNTDEQKRKDLAFERVKQYFVTCSYKIKIWPDDNNGRVPMWKDFKRT